MWKETSPINCTNTHMHFDIVNKIKLPRVYRETSALSPLSNDIGDGLSNDVASFLHVLIGDIECGNESAP